LRVNDGGLVYHVLNRANARLAIFSKDGDYEAFERVLAEAQERFGTRVLAHYVLLNHWHLVVWPEPDGELSRFTGPTIPLARQVSLMASPADPSDEKALWPLRSTFWAEMSAVIGSLRGKEDRVPTGRAEDDEG
jgi:REP element-mobilizing transposase RayT